MEPVALARHRQVLGTGQAHPHRAAGERRAQRRDGGEAVRLHLLAAEAAAHAQALHGDLVAVPAQHVRDDLLRLGRVLRAALHEDLPGLVDERQRAVRLQVEVLLAGELEVAAEDPRGACQAGLDVAAQDLRRGALEAARGDRLPDGHVRRQRLHVDLDGGRAQPRRLERLGEHPADGVAEEHHLVREERLVVLDAGVVDTGHVGGGEHADHAGHAQRRFDPQRGDPGVCPRHLHGVRVQHVLGPVDQVVGVQRRAGDVQRRALVRYRDPDGAVLRPLRELAHDPASAYSFSRLCSSIAAR
nr:hypothetical protein GCM10020092_069690 [Actinoplanes digitatis]